MKIHELFIEHAYINYIFILKYSKINLFREKIYYFCDHRYSKTHGLFTGLFTGLFIGLFIDHVRSVIYLYQKYLKINLFREKGFIIFVKFVSKNI